MLFCKRACINFRFQPAKKVLNASFCAIFPGQRFLQLFLLARHLTRYQGVKFTRSIVTLMRGSLRPCQLRNRHCDVTRVVLSKQCGGLSSLKQTRSMCRTCVVVVETSKCFKLLLSNQRSTAPAAKSTRSASAQGTTARQSSQTNNNGKLFVMGSSWRCTQRLGNSKYKNIWLVRKHTFLLSVCLMYRNKVHLSLHTFISYLLKYALGPRLIFVMATKGYFYFMVIGNDDRVQLCTGCLGKQAYYGWVRPRREFERFCLDPFVLLKLKTWCKPRLSEPNANICVAHLFPRVAKNENLLSKSTSCPVGNIFCSAA